MINFYLVSLIRNDAASSNSYEGWGAAVVGASIGAFFSWLAVFFTNDFNARNQCCHSLYELKKLLEKLAFYRAHPNQGEDGYYPILMNIEKVVEKLDVEASGLLLKPPNLNGLISESLRLFKALDLKNNNPNFRPAYTASNLILEWAPSKTNRPCSDRIIGIQKFLKCSLPHRFWVRVFKS